MDCDILYLNIVLYLFLLVDQWSLKDWGGGDHRWECLCICQSIGVNYMASDGQVITLNCLSFVEKKTEKKVTTGM